MKNSSRAPRTPFPEIGEKCALGRRAEDHLDASRGPASNHGHSRMDGSSAARYG